VIYIILLFRGKEEDMSREVISPEVIEVIRQGRAFERSLHSKDRVDVPSGLWGEALNAEGIRSSRVHSSGAREARRAQKL